MSTCTVCGQTFSSKGDRGSVGALKCDELNITCDVLSMTKTVNKSSLWLTES
jgi:hypothetical protein